MKRTELLRRTPLASAVRLATRAPLRQVSAKRAASGPVPRLSMLKAKRPAPAVPAKVRAAIRVRSGGLCELQLHGCLGRATDACHRVARGMGGRHGAGGVTSARLSNVMAGCRVCHQWSTARPAESYELGLMLREGQDPSWEAVLYRGELSWLTDDGRVEPFDGLAVAA